MQDEPRAWTGGIKQYRCWIVVYCVMLANVNVLLLIRSIRARYNRCIVCPQRLLDHNGRSDVASLVASLYLTLKCQPPLLIPRASKLGKLRMTCGTIKRTFKDKVFR